MAEENPEQDRSEAATPFRLRKARQRGMIARGRDLGFVSALVAFAIVAEIKGNDLSATMTEAMRTSLVRSATMAGDPRWISAASGELARTVAFALLLPALIFVVVGSATEIIQNRGLSVSFEPLKPDFSRLNPATGIRRFFSVKMLLEALKSTVKFGVYVAAAWLFIRDVTATAGPRSRDGAQLASLAIETAGRLLLLFMLLAAIFAVIDQLLARRTFARQMRMSRREITRESREREGDPRLKRKRRQILSEIVKQARAATDVTGADILITNPTHYAVALRYRPEDGDAPIVQARGRNFWAQRMREAARRQGITIIRNPTLARALFHDGRVGKPIGQTHFVAVADIYIAQRRRARQQEPAR